MFLDFWTSLSGVWTELFGALFLALSFWMWGRWQGMLSWSRKNFMDRVLLSLNSIEEKEIEGKKHYALKLRTLFEKDIRECFLNEQAIKLVRENSAKTGPGSPIVLFDKEDSWFILNYLLNEISEKFAVGLVRRDMGLPVTAKEYIFCLTCERDGGIRVQKIRVMLIEKERLKNFPLDGELILESPFHTMRVQTLRKMKELYEKEPHHFMKMEICI
jgi:hypothetical protein